MKLGLLALVGLGLAAFVAPPTNAQTTGVGPYYATPSWDQTLPSSTRYIVLSNMNSDAVLDRETGLVWERAPDTTERTWAQARTYCVNKTVGNRKGWRLPTVDELATLYNPSGGGLPGAPFVGVGASWTSTLFLNDLGLPTPLDGFNIAEAYIVLFAVGGDLDGAFTQDTRSGFPSWCVRGASAGNTQ